MRIVQPPTAQRTGTSAGTVSGVLGDRTCDFDVPIVIVSYGNPQSVVTCARALSRLATEPKHEIFVAENAGAAAFDALAAELLADSGPCVAASPADTTPIATSVRQQSLRLLHDDGTPGPYIHLAEMPENVGYAGGVNAWLRPLLKVKGWRGAWILNPDTEPEPGALVELAVHAATRRKSLVGSRLVYKDNRIDTRGMVWRKMRGAVLGIDKHAPAAAEPDVEFVERLIDAPCGASTYATRELIDHIGLMREQYFLYFEDLEWGVRAKEHGRSIGYAHSSVVLHDGGASIGSADVRSRRSRLSVYLDSRNRLLFVREHHPRWLLWSIVIGLAECGAYVAVGSAPNFFAALRGLIAGIAGETGRPQSFSNLAQPQRF